MSRSRASGRWAEQLGKTPFFSSFGEQALRDVCRAGHHRTLARDETLWQRGERPDAVALVLLGRLDVVRITSKGGRILLNVLGPNAVVGLSTTAGEAHSADLVAAEATEVLILPGTTLRRLFAQHPELALRTMAYLGWLLNRATDELEASRAADLEHRVRRCLAHHSSGRREVLFTHEELAQQVGATRANVSRVLKRFERAGALRCHRGRLEILDLGRLDPDRQARR